MSHPMGAVQNHGIFLSSCSCMSLIVCIKTGLEQQPWRGFDTEKEIDCWQNKSGFYLAREKWEKSIGRNGTKINRSLCASNVNKTARISHFFLSFPRNTRRVQLLPEQKVFIVVVSMDRQWIKKRKLFEKWSWFSASSLINIVSSTHILEFRRIVRSNEVTVAIYYRNHRWCKKLGWTKCSTINTITTTTLALLRNSTEVIWEA